MSGSFAFVDHFAIDQRSRKQIRSHVMKGKNTASARAGRHCDSPQGDDSDSASKLTLFNFEDVRDTRIFVAHPDARLCSAFSGVHFAYARNDRERALVKQCPWNLPIRPDGCQICPADHNLAVYSNIAPIAYPSEFCKRTTQIESPWFEYVLKDEAYLCGAVAFAVAFSDFASGRKKLSEEYGSYFGRCLSLLKDKLSSAQALETSCVAVVLGLCLLSAAVADFEAVPVHIQGLRKLVAFRGGVETLAEEPNLMEKVQRADLEDALLTGLPPAFPSTLRNVEPRFPILGFSDVRFPSLDSIRNIHTGLADAAQNIQVLTRYLQEVSDGAKLMPGEYHWHITSNWGTLFELSPIAKSGLKHPVAEILHLALVSMMSFLNVHMGIPNPRRYDILTRRIIRVVNKIMAAGSSLSDRIDPMLMNWILHVILATLMRDTSHTWLIAKLKRVREINGFDNWQDAHASAKNYPWVPALHDKHIQAVFSVP